MIEFHDDANPEWDGGFDNDEPAPPTCTLCDSPTEPLGTLGNLNHFRCRGCGMGHSTPKETDDA